MPIGVIQVKGIKELRRAMRKEPLLEAPFRRFLEDAVEAAEGEVKRGQPAPLSGRLNASIKGKVLGGKVARQGKVTANATRKGFRYGYALNASAKFDKRGGGKTKGWFDDAAERAQPAVDRLADRMADEIERAFGR